jgi:transitional endoplasmic reticulum ATPase
MDTSTLAGLRAAFATSPDNMPLLMLMLKMHLENGAAGEAYAVIRDRTPESLPHPGARRLAADVARAANEPEAALRFVAGESAEDQMARAQLLLKLARPAEALVAYRRAVAENSALEDLDFLRTLDDAARAEAPGATSNVVPLRVDERRSRDGKDDEPEPLQRLAREVERITFADVGGLDEVKAEIHRRIILPFQKPSMFQRFRKRIGGGILVYGPPGCGKTLLARATAGECGAHFLNVSVTDVLSKWHGESEHNLKAIFDKARAEAPTVLFFDELEALAGRRGQAHSSDATARIASLFLSELDGFAQGNKGVLVLGATNLPWTIDTAFRRPGRFDRVFFVPPPDRAGRAAILAALLRERPAAGDLDIAGLAAATSWFSGADLRELIETAADEAIDQSMREGRESPITGAMLRRAMRTVKPTTQEWLTSARNYARYANEGGQYDDVLAFLRRHGKE